MTIQTVLMPDTDGSGEIVELCVQLGEQVAEGDALIVLESDKASMEVPSPANGRVKNWLVELGAEIATGTPLLELTSEIIAKAETELPDAINGAEDTAVAESVQVAEPMILTMPDAGGTGDVVEITIAVGDQIAEGDTLLVIESDKASMEVPAKHAGEVIEMMVSEGDTLDRDQPIAKIIPAQSGSAEADSVAVKQASKTISQTPPTGKESESTATKIVSPRTEKPLINPEVNAGPAVRRLARELGVVLADVTGSGRRGRIQKEDVKAYVRKRMVQAKQAKVTAAAGRGIPPIPIEDFSRYGEIEQQDLTGIAKATVAHMTRCWLNIPHVTLFDEVNIDDVEAFRHSIDPQSIGLSRKLTLLPFMIAVVAKALQQFPQFNVSLDPSNEQIIRKSYINIGFAVDTSAGLVVPVIRDADKKSIRELAHEVIRLSSKARERKLTVDDMQGGCFTISSMGAMGGTGFTPIINGPEVAILGIAKSAIKPQWDGEKFIPANQLPLCLSFDHRAINGGDAGRFMAYVHDTMKDIRRALL